MSDAYSTSAPPPDEPEYPSDQPDEPDAPNAKASQQEVNYRAGTPIKNCGLCEHFEGNPGKAPDGCESVDGTISPFGYCDIYLRQPNPFGDQHQYSMQGGQVRPIGQSASQSANPPPGLLKIGNRSYG